MALDVLPEHLEIVKKIFREMIPDAHVVIFGSRALGTSRAQSDLDLAIQDKDLLSIDTFSRLRLAFAESALPYRVDLVDMTNVDEDFKKIIERDGSVIF